MPIKGDAFGADAATEPTPEELRREGAEQAEEGAAAQEAEKPAKRPRRTKQQLIAAAEIPADDAITKVKFKETGVEAERPWLVAVELFRDGKAEFVDKPLKYAVAKMDQQKADAGAAEPDKTQERPLDPVDLDGLTLRWTNLQEQLDETKASDTEKIQALSEEAEMVRKQIIDGGGTDPASDEAYEQRTMKPDSPESGNKGVVPGEAEVGDEIVKDGNTYFVGHGGVPTSNPPYKGEKIIEGSSRWTWDGDKVARSDLKKARTVDRQQEPGFHDPAGAESSPTSSADSQPVLPSGVSGTTQGAAGGAPVEEIEVAGQKATVQREIVSPEMIEVTPGNWRVGTGILEKINLGDYSSIQLGPNTMSTGVVDDGRRVEVTMPQTVGEGRKAVVCVAAVEKYRELTDTCEYVTRLQRMDLIAFMEAVRPGLVVGQPQS